MKQELTTMAIAMKKSGYKLRIQAVHWPRCKGQKVVRVVIEQTTCKNVLFLVKEST